MAETIGGANGHPHSGATKCTRAASQQRLKPPSAATGPAGGMHVGGAGQRLVADPAALVVLLPGPQLRVLGAQRLQLGLVGGSTRTGDWRALLCGKSAAPDALLPQR